MAAPTSKTEKDEIETDPSGKDLETSLQVLPYSTVKRIASKLASDKCIKEFHSKSGKKELIKCILKTKRGWALASAMFLSNSAGLGLVYYAARYRDAPSTDPVGGESLSKDADPDDPEKKYPESEEL